MKKRLILSVVAVLMAVTGSYAQNFNGLDMNLGNLSRLSDAKTRSISPKTLRPNECGYSEMQLEIVTIKIFLT